MSFENIKCIRIQKQKSKENKHAIQKELQKSTFSNPINLNTGNQFQFWETKKFIVDQMCFIHEKYKNNVLKLIKEANESSYSWNSFVSSNHFDFFQFIRQF